MVFFYILCTELIPFMVENIKRFVSYDVYNHRKYIFFGTWDRKHFCLNYYPTAAIWYDDSMGMVAAARF